MFEITGVLASLLVWVEDEAVRTQRPAALTVEAGPVLVALVGVGEQEAVLRQLGVGWTSEIESKVNYVSTVDQPN